MLKMLDSWSRGTEFKTARWLQEGPYSLLFLIVHKYNNTRCNPTPQTYSSFEGTVALQIILLHNTLTKRELEGCVHYIFASLFFKSKRQHSWNCGKCFLFHFKSSFHSRENQILEFQIFKFHDVIKYLSIKQEIHFT